MLLELQPRLEDEYRRFLGSLEPVERLSRPCLSADTVLRAHFLIANHFVHEGAGIGGIGLRSPELLHSAVHRQVVSLGGELKWDRLFDIAATLFFGLIKAHAFHDANKRTAFLALLFQLYESGFCPTVHESEIETLTVEVAENNLGRYSRYKDLVGRRVNDPEVVFISKWLKDNTRRYDNKKRAVTYRELDLILRRYGIFLESPDNNHIEVVRYVPRKTFFGLGKPVTDRVRIGLIGFPRWSAQVYPNVLHHVRKLTSLSAQDGVDSVAFFEGLDPMQSLIATYNEPLMRLAYR